MLLHQASFRRAVERRDWSRIASLIDPAYSDRWGYIHDSGIAQARPWLGQFFTLTITPMPAGDLLTPDGGAVTEQWRLSGAGAEGASLVIDRVNQASTPFIFTWKHRSWKPWDWTLIQIDNPSLNLTSTDIL